MTRRLVACLVPLLVSAAIAACGGGEDEPVSGNRPSGKITVFAAASLTQAFEEVAVAFEERYPGTEVDFNFGGTPTLRAQLEQGARADVFASADQRQMELALEHGLVEAPASVFARNSLVIITPLDNRAEVTVAADLARDGLKLVVAQEAVPVGAYTQQALSAMSADPRFGAGFQAAVMENVISLESNVKQVVAKVELGEADAGIVYASDVDGELASRLNRIEITKAFNVVAEYPIAPVIERRNHVAAQAFIDFLLSEPGQAILVRYGFVSRG